MRKSAKLLLALGVVLLCYHIRWPRNLTVGVGSGRHCRCEPPAAAEPLWNRTLDFFELDFSNETGTPTGEYLVPNFVHFIEFGGEPLTYVHLICVLAAYKNQRPERLYFHYDDNNTFTGKYWETLEGTPGVRDVLRLIKVEVPSEVFGQELSDGWRRHHGSDVLRIRLMMQYGGIYLDNDCYTMRSLDDLRRYEVTIGWGDDKSLGNQVIIAHKSARFLRRWLDLYRQYDRHNWYWNAGEKPTEYVLYREPHLIHRVKDQFISKDFTYLGPLYRERWDEKQLRSFYIFHLLERWNHMVQNISSVAYYPVTFTETNIVHYPVTFRDMAIAVYDTAGVDWPRNDTEGTTE